LTTGLSNHSNNANVNRHTPIHQYNPNVMDYNSMYNISNMNAIQNNSGFGLKSLDYSSDEVGENIKVCIRIRPLNLLETGRGDNKCVEYANLQTLHFQSKNISKNYSFNCVFNENTSQEEMFVTCGINVTNILK
jgi:kinesin family protein 12